MKLEIFFSSTTEIMGNGQSIFFFFSFLVSWAHSPLPPVGRWNLHVFSILLAHSTCTRDVREGYEAILIPHEHKF